MSETIVEENTAAPAPLEPAPLTRPGSRVINWIKKVALRRNPAPESTNYLKGVVAAGELSAEQFAQLSEQGLAFPPVTRGVQEYLEAQLVDPKMAARYPQAHGWLMGALMQSYQQDLSAGHADLKLSQERLVEAEPARPAFNPIAPPPAPPVGWSETVAAETAALQAGLTSLEAVSFGDDDPAMQAKVEALREGLTQTLAGPRTAEALLSHAEGLNEVAQTLQQRFDDLAQERVASEQRLNERQPTAAEAVLEDEAVLEAPAEAESEVPPSRWERAKTALKGFINRFRSPLYEGFSSEESLIEQEQQRLEAGREWLSGMREKNAATQARIDEAQAGVNELGVSLDESERYYDDLESQIKTRRDVLVGQAAEVEQDTTPAVAAPTVISPEGPDVEITVPAVEVTDSVEVIEPSAEAADELTATLQDELDAAGIDIENLPVEPLPGMDEPSPWSPEAAKLREERGEPEPRRGSLRREATERVLEKMAATAEGKPAPRLVVPMYDTRLGDKQQQAERVTLAGDTSGGLSAEDKAAAVLAELDAPLGGAKHAVEQFWDPQAEGLGSSATELAQASAARSGVAPFRPSVRARAEKTRALSEELNAEALPERPRAERARGSQGAQGPQTNDHGYDR